MRRATLLAILILLGASLLAGCGAGKSYSADRFDVDATIAKDGSLQVTETILFRFTGGPFTYVWRKLPAGYTDGISDVTASMDGKLLPRGTGAGQVELENDNPIKITWRFASTSDSTHTFVLTYRMAGVVRQEADADRLLWNALPNDHNYRIAQASVKVSYPTSAQLIPASAGIRRGKGTATTGLNSVTFTAENLSSDAPLQVEMRFRPGSLIETPPAWQTRSAQARLSAPTFGGAAVAVLLLGVLGLIALWNGRRREAPEKPAFTYSALSCRPTAPPSDLAPAIAGALNGSGSQPSWANAVATLFDLARRGVLRIDESAQRTWYRKHDFVLDLLDQPANLRPHEAGLLRLLFEGKKGATATSVKLSDLRNRLATRLKWFNEPLKEEMRAAGFLEPERTKTRNSFFLIGVLLLAVMLAGLVLAVVLVPRFEGWPFLILGSLFVLSLTAFVMGAAYSPLSDRGSQEAAAWQGFYEYLRDVTRGREPAWDLRQFERYLPYAASYGLAEKWAKAFKERGGAEIPVWFHAVAAAPDQAMGAFIAFTAASHSTGSSGGAGGAGGAAGGGGSGAG
ncbi:MAG: DUF2207 domain-containing protein [Chloroflexi bacterium]|nr:DUF2207 domain-containing protein [Chloroflexota bacterium]